MSGMRKNFQVWFTELRKVMTTNSDFKYVFGPVPSRRLGRSLGVDLVPFKTCTYDCIYCQLGRTTKKTIQRQEYVPLDKVLRELRRKLTTCKPDYITLSGSGEPTLYSPLKALIRGIKKETAIPLAVLTNGSLLWNRNVQDALLLADLVIPSLDAADESMFQYVNRPHASISFDRMVKGLIDFRSRYSGTLWLEVFLLGGVTGVAAEVSRINKIAKRLKPDRIQLNTVTRPPAEEFAFPTPEEQMKRFCRLFSMKTEFIAAYHGAVGKADIQSNTGDILNLLRRRPCTLKDVASGLSLHPTQAAKALETLLCNKQISEQRTNGCVYFSIQQKKNIIKKRRAK